MGILVRDKGCRGGAGKSCKCHILKSLGLCFKRNGWHRIFKQWRGTIRFLFHVESRLEVL